MSQLQAAFGAPIRRVHDAIEDAEWQRPHLDRAARWSLRPQVRAYVDGAAPARLVPELTHTVSVVIPCYNYARFLPQAVASALAQEAVEIEVIVVDDCSTDDSLAVARTLAAADPRVTVIVQPENRGHVRTFNEGLSHASGEFVVRLDADDILTAGSVTRAVALFEELPDVGLVYGHPRHFVDDDVPTGRHGTITWTVWSGQEWIARRCDRGVNCITTPEAIVRASVLDRVGGLNMQLKFAQDMEMWLRVAAVSDVARINDVDQALHRDHGASMSVNDGSGILNDLEERRTVFTELFASVGDHIADADQLRARAMRSLAAEALRHASYAYDRGAVDPIVETELIAFAVTADPTITRTIGWRSHALRQRCGAGIVRRDPLALVRIARVRARDELAYLQWTRTGL